MPKIMTIAWREFAATVLTKGFLIGVIVLPILLTSLMPLAILLVNKNPPIVKGSIAVIDRSGVSSNAPEGLAASEITDRLTPEALAEKLKIDTEQGIEKAKAQLDKLPVSPEQAKAIDGAMANAKTSVASQVPNLTVEVLPADTNLDDAKQALKTGTNFDGSRLAIIVVDDTAVLKPNDAEAFGTFQMFVKNRLDVRAQGLIRGQVRDAIIASRIAANGEDPARIRALTRLDTPDAIEVRAGGENKSSELRQMLLPLAFMLLLWISVFTGGNFLLYSTIEEKSNRVMEVLLSAVSPMQLMTGKILGQMAASLLILLLYSGLGIAGLLYFAAVDMIDWLSLVYLFVFFFIAFFMIASMMAAIGSAVTDIHEAQTLMTPVMLVVMTPMFLMMPIIWNPKSALATTLSFVPPVNPFVMVLRLASAEPPPTWQVLLSMAIGFVTVYLCLRGAAKIFRIGVLMYGKPPNFTTLVKWIRMA